MNQPDERSGTSVEETLHWASSQTTRDLTGVTLGDFQVERLLGRGGMGEVYLARQISLNRPVALKVLRSDLLSKPIYLTRFEAEAAAVAKLNHPNIVHVYMLGNVDGTRFIVMEYVQGTNLREYIRKKGAVDFPLALSIMKQAAVAVGAAGERGLIHRDIKPENLLLTRKGQVKVTDFGLCRDLDANRVSVTQTGLTMGTPLYMSPEQAQGLELDHRSDLYSLGVTFYHMLTGVPPFKAETPLALALKHVKDIPPSMTVHRSDIPPELDRLVLKLIAKAPADRYQSAAEMLKDLAKIRETMQGSSATQPVTEIPGSAFDKPNSILSTVVASPATQSATPVALEENHGPVVVIESDWRSRFKAAGVALALLGFVVGSILGWLSRPADLLAAATVEPKTMPGLWIAPRWSEVPPALSAEDQYHYAQFVATKDDLEGAWIAVAGRFPGSRDWASRAYTQLARLLLLKQDKDRLKVLATEIDRWDSRQTLEKELVDIMRAGVKVLNGDIVGVREDFNTILTPSKLTDPALIELSLEVIAQAELSTNAAASARDPIAREDLSRIQNSLLSRLSQSEPRDRVIRPLRPR